MIHNFRALITRAQALIAHWRLSIARPCYYKIVCAWCHQTIRWQRTEEAVRGLISHSICLTCFADVLQELDPANALPPVPTKAETAPLASYLRLVP